MDESKVELTGFVARQYDTLLNLVSLGKYSAFIRNAIQKMNIQPEDKIADFGCGTGRNACLMAEYINSSGKIVGLDIGDEMVEQFEQNCEQFPNVNVKKQRIDEPINFEEKFDKVLLSFVFHGFPDDKKEIIIENVKNALKVGGSLFLLDWEEFDLSKKSFLFQWAFKKFECRLAQDYLKVNWKERLAVWGFGNFGEHLFFKNNVRLLRAALLKK